MLRYSSKIGVKGIIYHRSRIKPAAVIPPMGVKGNHRGPSGTSTSLQSRCAPQSGTRYSHTNAVQPTDHDESFWCPDRTGRLPQDTRYPVDPESISKIHHVSEARKTSTVSSLLDSLAESVHQNVAFVLKILSEQHIQSSKEKSAGDRWQIVLDRERQRNHQRSDSRRKLSVEEMWEQALLFANLHPEQPSEMTSRFSDLLNSQGCNNPSNEPVATILSPIFRLPLNQHLHAEHLASILDNDPDDEADYMDVLQTTDWDTSDSVFRTTKIAEASLRRRQDAIFQSIALLSIMGPGQWKYLCSPVHNDNYNCENTEEDLTKQSSAIDHTKISLVQKDCSALDLARDFLEEVIHSNHTLTTFEANLLLANLLTAPDVDSQTLVGEIMMIFNEMKILAESGQSQSGPDATTFRILILSFNQRFMAPSDAVKFALEMMNETSVIVTPETFLEAMKACHAIRDIKTSRSMIDKALSENIVRPTVGSYLILVEMMKSQDLRKEVLELFDQLHDTKMVSKLGKEYLLKSICRWPRRSRRGDFVDRSDFQLKILARVEKLSKEDHKPSMGLWMKLVEEISFSARRDLSLWSYIGSALYTILELYPRHRWEKKMVNIGLEASVFADDSNLAAAVLRNVVANDSPDAGDTNYSSLLPFQAIKAAMGLCIKTGDAQSAESIVASLRDLGDVYPLGAAKELYSLLLMCHTAAGEPDKALSDLTIMAELGMEPGEELHGAVLHSLVVTDKNDEAESFFRSMETDRDNGYFVAPKETCFDAILHGRIRKSDWNGVLDLYEKMQERDIRISSKAIHGILLAQKQIGGQSAVVSTVNSLLRSEFARFGESAFRLVSDFLLEEPSADSFDSYREGIRSLGEKDHHLRKASISLVRSVRVAEIECGRSLSSVKMSESELEDIQDKAWADAMKLLLDFVKAKQESTR